MVKYINNPVASTKVVINGADRTAGSTPTRCAAIGMIEPTAVDHMQIAQTVTAMVSANLKSRVTQYAWAKATIPSITPTSSPVVASRTAMRQAFLTPISPSERLRMTVMTVCAPALPPVPISNGTKKVSATTAASSSSKLCNTLLVKVPATNRNSSHPMRFRTTWRIGLSKYGRSSAPGSTAAIRNMSSVCSSISTSITSSTVTKPTTTPSSSSTGTARRLYLAILLATVSWSSPVWTVTGLRRITSVMG